LRLGRSGVPAIAVVGMALACLALSLRFERSEFGMQSGIAGMVLAGAAAALLSAGLYAAWLDARRLGGRPPTIRTKIAAGVICVVAGTVSAAMLSWAVSIIEMHVLSW